MYDYEMVLVINPEIQVAEGENHPIIEKVSNPGKGGSIIAISRWGKRRLAYPINRFTEGEYVLAQFQIPPLMVKELEANLKLTEDILRHLLVRVNTTSTAS
ncbi:MAG: 30S ribosomal protein S6 [Chloroflexi bacterium]|nr:30S ribosomal protein S6 [Chloroflexota bacterium]